MKTIGLLTTTLLIMVYTVLMNGWALAKLWAWFIVPTFSAPPLSIPAAIGVSLVVSYLTFHAKTDDKDEEDWVDILIRGALVGTLKPLFALGVGAIVAAFL